MTTFIREMGKPPVVGEVYRLLEEHYSTLLGGLEPAAVDERLSAQAKQLSKSMLAPEWLLRRGRRQTARALQLRSGVDLAEGIHKTPGGLIRAAVAIDRQTERVLSVSFSGDFFIYPSEGLDWLEDALKMCDCVDMLDAVQRVYVSQKIETPGVQPEDWVRALEAASES